MPQRNRSFPRAEPARLPRLTTGLFAGQNQTIIITSYSFGKSNCIGLQKQQPRTRLPNSSCRGEPTGTAIQMSQLPRITWTIAHSNASSRWLGFSVVRIRRPPGPPSMPVAPQAKETYRSRHLRVQRMGNMSRRKNLGLRHAVANYLGRSTMRHGSRSPQLSIL